MNKDKLVDCDLKLFRVIIGLTQEKLAKELDITRQTLTNHERKKKVPKALFLATCLIASLEVEDSNKAVLRAFLENVNSTLGDEALKNMISLLGGMEDDGK